MCCVCVWYGVCVYVICLSVCGSYVCDLGVFCVRVVRVCVCSEVCVCVLGVCVM